MLDRYKTSLRQARIQLIEDIVSALTYLQRISYDADVSLGPLKLKQGGPLTGTHTSFAYQRRLIRNVRGEVTLDEIDFEETDDTTLQYAATNLDSALRRINRNEVGLNPT